MPKTAEHLKSTRWKKGQSGNPGGRPKKRPITDEYFELADKPLPKALCKKLDLPEGTTFSQANAIMRYADALEKGGHMSSKEIREAIEGKAPQRLEISGPERKEISIKVSFDRKTK